MDLRALEISIAAARERIAARRDMGYTKLLADQEHKDAKRIARVTGEVVDLLRKGAISAATREPIEVRLVSATGLVLTLSVPDSAARFELDRTLREGLGNKLTAAGGFRRVKVVVHGQV